MRRIKKDQALTWGLGIYGVATLTSMAGMSIGAAIAGVTMLVALGPGNYFRSLRELSRRPTVRIYLVIALVFAFTLLLSLFIADLKPLSFGGKPYDVHYGKDMAKAWYLFWPVLLLPGLNALSLHQRRQVLGAWLWAFGILALLGITQFFTGWPRPQMIPGFEPRYHATLFLGHHLSVASILIFPFFAALDYLPRLAPAGKRWLILFTGFGLVTLLLTFSRMMWLALPVGLFFWLMYYATRKGKIVVLILVAIALGLISQVPAVQTRMRYGEGVGSRIQLWKLNYEMFKERPLTGAGWHKNLDAYANYMNTTRPGQDHFVGHAHNNFIEMIASTGILGTLAWLVFCIYPIILLWRGRTLRGPDLFPVGLLAAFVVFHLNGLTQVNFWEAKVQHQVMFMIAWTLLWSMTGKTKRENRN